MDKFDCIKCENEFGSEEALAQHMQAKHPEEVKKPKFQLSSKQKRKIKNWLIFIVIVIIFIGGFYFLRSSIKTLPPIDMEGHVEAYPQSRVLKEPIPTPVHKHILEHVKGGGPGVVINYNCQDYVCEDDLVEKLEAFAGKYNAVYVAPFPKMDVKIALTKLGKIETLNSYDEERIEKFIWGR